MRRTLLTNTTTTTTATIIFILIAVSWLSYTPVQGSPAGSRRTLTEPSSARRRDELIAGSDFLDMFIGTSVAPSVRSRRFPTSRSSAELRNRFYRERIYPSGVMTQYRNHPSDSHSVAEQSEKLTGLVSSHDRQSAQQSQQFKVLPEGDRSHGKALDVLQQENSANQEVRDAEGAGFGSRTVPRLNRVVMSVSTERESDALNGDISKTFRHNANDETERTQQTIRSSADEERKRQHSSSYQVNPSENNRVPVRGVNTLVSPRFSVSSSVHKITYKTEQKYNSDRTVHSTQTPLTTSNTFSSTSREPVATEDTEIQEMSTQDIHFTGAAHPTTDSNTFSTVDEVSTVTTSVEPESTTETTDDWSTKSDAFTTIGGYDKLISEDTESPIEDDEEPMEEAPVHVVSFRVSSSVGQSSSSQSQEEQSTQKAYTTVEALTSESDSAALPDYEDASAPEEASLVTEEQPLAKNVQRSELNVEESVPSEVTAGPQRSYLRLNAPPMNFYQYSPEKTTSDSESSASSYQPTSTTSSGRNRLFGKYPGYRRPFTSARRATAELSSIDAAVVETNQRRFSPRFTVERTSSRAQSKEPVSVAESIQRSVIANQEVDDSESKSVLNRGQYHQDKAGYGDQLKNEEDDVEGFSEDQSKFDNGRGRKSYQIESIDKTYSQPERMYGRPEKVYGEPEKVYGEPEKVYGEPAKVYGEPAKVYGEPSKVYGEPSKVYSEPAKVYGEPSKVYSEPSKVYSEPAQIYGEPAKVYSEPSKVYGEPSKIYAVPEQNYEVDESVSVETNGRAHGIQPAPKVTQPPTQVENDMKVFETRQQDPNHKFGYVVEGRDYRKYRVEERTSDGFIVGEYGVVSNDGGNLRGVRYTADGTINPRLIYDTLLKFLSL